MNLLVNVKVSLKCGQTQCLSDVHPLNLLCYILFFLFILKSRKERLTESGCDVPKNTPVYL